MAQEKIVIFHHDERGIVRTWSEVGELVRCKDCIHKPRIASETGDVGDGFDIEFPDGRCPCQCSDEYYNWMPYDDWFCGNGERRTDER